MLNKLAIISGSTGGIGRVVTERLWHEGYSIVALGHTLEKCRSLQEWFLDNPRGQQESNVLSIDLRDDTQLWRISTILTDQWENYNIPTELLVTCHGADPFPAPATISTKTMERIYEIDVLGTYRLCQVVGRMMIAQRRGGCIALVSSLHAQQTFPERVPYATSKAAVCGIARALAVEWGMYGISVNALCPWQVDGPRTNAFIKQAHEQGVDLLGAYKKRSPMRRLVQPEEIANTVIWLTQTRSVTGQSIVIDAGVSASMWHEGYMER